MSRNPVHRIPPDLVIGPSAGFLALDNRAVNWGMDVFNVEAIRQAAAAAPPIKLGVVDTGVDKSHPLLGNVADAKDFTGSRYGAHDVHSHGCVAPWDKVVTSLCGLQTAEYLFDNAPGIAHFLPDRRAIIKDVSRYGVYTFSADPKTGDTVKAKVLAVHKLHHTGPVYKVRTRDGELTLTPWHPVYLLKNRTGETKRVQKVRADELSHGDVILLSGAGPDVGQVVRMPYQTRWVCVHCGYEAAGGKRERCRGCHKYHWHEGPTSRTITLDEDLAFWLGLVASDGHVYKSERQKSVDFTNTDVRVGGEFARLSKELFGVEPKAYQYGDKATVWRLNCVDAHRLAIACGIPAGDKSRTPRLPNLVTKSPRAVVMSFLAGMLEGDGNVRRTIRLRTGSEEFA
ncbi:MAG: hypothetical protein K2V38_10015, partial [Gemmataceae bacterium]|nr:hypothetical protein [Gemmataceae bacterium]